MVTVTIEKMMANGMVLIGIYKNFYIKNKKTHMLSSKLFGNVRTSEYLFGLITSSVMKFK